MPRPVGKLTGVGLILVAALLLNLDLIGFRTFAADPVLKGNDIVYSRSEYKIDLLPKVKLELAVRDALLNPVVETLTAAVRTGKIGDGKIFVATVDEAIRIRNGHRGESAL